MSCTLQRRLLGEPIFALKQLVVLIKKSKSAVRMWPVRRSLLPVCSAGVCGRGCSRTELNDCVDDVVAIAHLDVAMPESSLG